MRALGPLFAALTTSALLCVGCANDDEGPGVCVITHEALPDDRYRAPTISDCEEYCASVEGYVCCYYEPEGETWVPIDGDC